MAFKVTPWEVSGKVDYKKLRKEFGVKLIDMDKGWRLTEITKTQRTIMEKMGYQFPIPF